MGQTDKEQLNKYRQRLTIKKNMVRNFVGRTKERSKLEPADVEDLPFAQTQPGVGAFCLVVAPCSSIHTSPLSLCLFFCFSCVAAVNLCMRVCARVCMCVCPLSLRCRVALRCRSR